MFHTIVQQGFFRGGEKYCIYFVDSLSLCPTVKQFSKLVNSWWSYCKNATACFFETVYTTFDFTCPAECWYTILLLVNISICTSLIILSFVLYFYLHGSDSIYFDMSIQDSQVWCVDTYYDGFHSSSFMDEFSVYSILLYRCQLLVFTACRQMILQQTDI